MHGITMSHDTRFYVDNFTSRTQPPQVSLRSADGSLVAFLLENRLGSDHPDAPYLADNSIPEFGTLAAADGQALYYRLFKPPHFDPARRYPAIVDVYGGPGVQRVLDNWTGSSFTQILTRAGYVVFQLDNRGSASRGTAFQAPIHDRLGDVEVADQVQGARWLGSQSLRRPGAHRRVGLELRRLPDADADVQGARGVSRRGRGRARHRLVALRHALHRALPGAASRTTLPATPRAACCPTPRILRGKLLVMHGMADDNVLFLHSTKLFRKLQDLGKPFEVMVYPGAKHGLLRQHDGRHAYGRSCSSSTRTCAALRSLGQDS